MKKIITLFLISLETCAFTQPNLDSLYKVQQKQITTASQSIEQLKEQNEIFQQTVSNQQLQMNSLCEQLEINSKNLQTLADSIGVQIQQANDGVQENANKISSKATLSLVLIGIALFIAICITLLLHRRLKASSKDEISKLKAQADDLNEKVVDKMSDEISKLQTISKGFEEINAETAHSLVKTFADRITFMEMTLYKMDASIKGHKQLSKSIKQMKDNLLANGYELVDMLGKDYNDGMKVTASFIEDDNLEQGKQIISGVIKPQINYQGEMIQSAQITVSQNI